MQTTGTRTTQHPVLAILAHSSNTQDTGRALQVWAEPIPRVLWILGAEEVHELQSLASHNWSTHTSESGPRYTIRLLQFPTSVLLLHCNYDERCVNSGKQYCRSSSPTPPPQTVVLNKFLAPSSSLQDYNCLFLIGTTSAVSICKFKVNSTILNWFYFPFKMGRWITWPNYIPRQSGLQTWS